MIIPGLLSASTNKADYLGMSTDRVACLSMIAAPFAACFSLINAGFPLRSDVRTRVGAQPTQALPERSGGLGGFAESWRLGSRGRMRAKKGETNSKLLVISRRGCDYTKEDATDYRLCLMRHSLYYAAFRTMPPQTDFS